MARESLLDWAVGVCAAASRCCVAGDVLFKKSQNTAKLRPIRFQRSTSQTPTHKHDTVLLSPHTEANGCASSFAPDLYGCSLRCAWK